MEKIKVALGSDHKGYQLKQIIIEHLNAQGIETIDYGTNSSESVDYPDFAKKVCLDVTKQNCTFGILVCYTGIGMSIVANKFKGIRAALVGSVENAQLTRNHNNANVLCLGAKDTNNDLALEIVDKFISEGFLGERHKCRVNKIEQIENEQF